MELHSPGTKSSDHGYSPISRDLNLPSVDAEVHPEMSVLVENPPQLGGHHRTEGRGQQPGHQYRAGAPHRWLTEAAPGHLRYGGHCSFDRCSDRRREPRKGSHHLNKPALGSLSLETSACMAVPCGDPRTAEEEHTALKHSCRPRDLSAQGNCGEPVERVCWSLA